MDIKNEILVRLDAVYHTLDHTMVSGRQNVTNISASLGILEEVIAAIRKSEVSEAADGQPVNGDG